MLQNLIIYVNHWKRLYRQMFQPLSARYGLTQLEIDILLFLRNNPTYNTARDITTMRGFAKSNVSQAVDRLRQRGYLAAAPEPFNRKVFRLALQKDKQPCVEELVHRQELCFSVILQGFVPEERDLLQQFLQRADHNIQKALQKETKEIESGR